MQVTKGTRIGSWYRIKDYFPSIQYLLDKRKTFHFVPILSGKERTNDKHKAHGTGNSGGMYSTGIRFCPHMVKGWPLNLSSYWAWECNPWIKMSCKGFRNTQSIWSMELQLHFTYEVLLYSLAFTLWDGLMTVVLKGWTQSCLRLW